MDLLNALGMNIVRLGVLMVGTMPEARGVVDESYLADAKTMIEALNDKGIFTLVSAPGQRLWHRCRRC